MSLFAFLCYFLNILPSIISQIPVLPLAKTLIDPQPLVYETTAKIFFNITLPSMVSDNLFGYVSNLPSCPSADSAFGTHCPLQYHLQESIISLSKRILSINSELEGSEQNHNLNNQHICDSVSQHFASKKSTQSVIDDYYDTVKKCKQQLWAVTPISRPIEDIHPFYSQALQDYTSEYYSGTNQQIDNAAHGITNAALLLWDTFHNYIQANTLREALEICSSGQFPLNVIPEDNLLQELKNLEPYISLSGLRPIYSIVANNIGTFASLPLTDCTISSDYNYIFVRLLVPLVREQSEWREVNLHSIPFRHLFQGEDYICYRNVGTENNRKYFIDNSTYDLNNSYVEPDCFEAKGQRICKVPTQNIQTSWRPWKKTCEQIVLQNNPQISDILNSCPLECSSSGDFNIPLIQHEPPSTFYIVGDPSEDVIVQCPGVQDRLFRPPAEGALRLIIECGCQITVSGRTFSPDPFLCGSVNDAAIVVPFNFKRSS